MAGGSQLGPATAGLSVKGLPVTENFLRVQTGDKKDRDRMGRWRLCPAMGVDTQWRRRELERNTG